MSATTTVTATEASATLTWSAVSGAASYGVWRTDGDVVYVADTSYTFTGLNPHQTYDLSVWTRTADGVTGPSAGAQVTMPARPGVPRTAAPTTVTTSGLTASSVTVNWSGVAGATGYRIGRSGSERVYLAGTARSYAFSGLAASRTYSVWLEAIGHGGISTRVTQSFTTAAPPAPSGLNAMSSSTGLTLSWNIVDDATGYEVKQGADGDVTAVAAVARRKIEVGLGTGLTMTATVSGVSHVFTGLTANTEYTLYVRTRNSDGVSDWASLSATTAPAAPGGLSATATSTTITLSWNAVTGATGYEVQQGSSSPAVAVSGTSHTFSDLSAGTTYRLDVLAKNGSGISDWSSLTATTAPAAPSDLSATATSTTIALSWSAVTDATGYEVKQGATGAETTASSDTSHIFSGLTANTSYTLYARTVSGDETSDWASLSSTTAPLAPRVDEQNRLSNENGFELVWQAAAGAAGYEVKIGPDGAKRALDATTTSHKFLGLTDGVEYTFYVRAVNSWGASEWSESMTMLWRRWIFSRVVVPPAAPGGLEASASGADLKLSWTAARLSATTTYEVKLNADGDATAADSVNGHTFSGLTAGTEYTLYVRAKNDSGGPSPWSWVAKTTAPAAPSGLNATATSTSITLSWSAATGATGYDVKQGEGGIETAVSSGASHTFPNLTANTAYTLYVRAKNSGGDSDWASLSATTAPAAPSGLGATATSTTITLSWSAVTGATGYEVKQGESGTETSVPSGTSHTFPDLTANTAYTLYVRAKNSGGDSDWASLSATTAPAAPIGVTAVTIPLVVSPGQYDHTKIGSLSVSWPSVAGATAYEVKLGEDGSAITVLGTVYAFSSVDYGADALKDAVRNGVYVRAKNSSGVSAWRSSLMPDPSYAPFPTSPRPTLVMAVRDWARLCRLTPHASSAVDAECGRGPA